MKIDLEYTHQSIGDTISILTQKIQEGNKEESIELLNYLHGFVSGVISLLSKGEV